MARGYVGVRISDGLGNQMFQYATALAMAKRLRVPMRCDVSSYQRNPNRQLALSAFGLQVPSRLQKLAEDWRLLRPDPSVPIIRDCAEFVPEILTAAAPVRLEGWFQNWRYLEGAHEQVRRAFDFDRIPLTAGAADWLAQIRAEAVPVALHVRWGDYRLRPDAFPLLDREHYGRARSRLEFEVRQPTYFVFSDEPEVAARIASDWPNTRLVTGLSAMEDFRLMASCHHFLVANSTFSWWAAWLGRFPGKRVIAPKVWFGAGFSRAVDIDGRLPPDWIRV